MTEQERPDPPDPVDAAPGSEPQPGAEPQPDAVLQPAPRRTWGPRRTMAAVAIAVGIAGAGGTAIALAADSDTDQPETIMPGEHGPFGSGRPDLGCAPPGMGHHPATPPDESPSEEPGPTGTSTTGT